ncbi:MAG: PQQ-binding-like beta-propeller repeat protein [Polyangiaceae bacterium]|nr:PQQ-binding-like beta-propeller repeat protein [Polyangiaceae bacterium]
MRSFFATSNLFRRSGGASLLGLILGLGTGCGAFELAGDKAETANDRVNPENPLWYERPAAVMGVSFHRELTIRGRTTGEEYEHGQAEIDPYQNRIFVGSSDFGLYALRSTDGSSLWRYQTTGPVQSEPYYDRELDIVYFGSHDGALYAVRAYDGSLVYRFNTGAEVTRRPAHNGETLYVANAADHLFAIDRRTGKLRWQTHRPSALGKEVAGYAGASYDNGIVYMAYSDGHVAAYNAADGTERWAPVDLIADVDDGADSVKYLDVDTTPIVDGPPNARVVYVASYAGGVYALDAKTGSRVWWNERATGVTELSLFQEPAHKAGDGTEIPAKTLILATSSSTGLWALDTAGKMVWRNKVPEGGITAPVPCAGALLVGTSRHGLFLISPRNGRTIDGLDPGTGFSQTPAAFGNKLFALSNGGVLLGAQVAVPKAERKPDDYAWFGRQ